LRKNWGWESVNIRLLIISTLPKTVSHQSTFFRWALLNVYSFQLHGQIFELDQTLISLIQVNVMKMNASLLVKEIKAHLVEHLKDDISDVVIFGSQIKENGLTNSDYDVLIVLRKDYNQKMKRLINDLCYDIDLKYDIFLDTQIISENELKDGLRGKHPIFKIALNEGLHA
jgi:predicted nucleotidyltransferase